MNLLSRFFKNGLRERLLLAFTCLLLLFSVLFLTAFGWLEWRSYKRILMENGTKQAQTISDACALALYTDNVWLANARIGELIPLSNNLVFIYKNNGDLWQLYGDSQMAKDLQIGREGVMDLLNEVTTSGGRSVVREQGGYISFFVPISVKNMADYLLLGEESLRHIGLFQLVIPDDTPAYIQKLLTVAGGILCFLLLIAVVVIHMLSSLLSEPLLHLTKQAELARNERNFRFHAYGTYEIQELVYAFNSLITSRNQAEREVITAKERLETMMSTMSDLVYVVNEDYKIVYANTAVERLFGPDALGQTCCVYLHACDTPPCEDCPNTRLLESGEVLHWSAKRGDRLLELSSLAIELLDGIKGVMHVARDVTDTRRLEEERIKAQRFESIGMLAAGIAHDFNNVLMAILGNVSLAKMFLSPGTKSYERLEHAERACDKAKALANQLLAFAKGGAPVKRLLDMGKLVKECVEFSSHGRNVRIEFDIPADIWQAEVDEGQIGQVINNLVVNAMQVMPDGGIISVHMQNLYLKAGNALELAEGPYVLIAVQDTGPGIASEVLPKIFDPFFTTKPMGSGLGLATSYTIIKRHKGRITAESELGKGAVFRIYLPANPEERVRSDLPDRVENVFMTAASTRVLIMDDEDMVFQALEGMLGVLGFTAHRARDGAEAVQAYKDMLASGERYYAVILDLTIPGGMGGKDTLQVLLALDSKVRAIACSGYANDPVMVNPESHGFVAALAKPVGLNELKRVFLELSKSDES